MNFIFGASGFAKEVDWVIHEIFKFGGKDYRSGYFVVEDGNDIVGEKINSRVILSEKDAFKKLEESEIICFLAIGNPEIRKIIFEKIISINKKATFPNLIHPDVSYDNRPGKLNLGIGNIICSKTVISTDINIENFVHVNFDCTIGHDTNISSFSTLSPGTHISGNVNICESVYLGTGSVVLERVSICPSTTVGASATIVKSIQEPGTYVGTPAIRIK